MEEWENYPTVEDKKAEKERVLVDKKEHNTPKEWKILRFKNPKKYQNL